MVLDVHGLPLIVQTAKRALQSNATSVVVATDHNDILAICKEHNITAVLTKVEHNSGTERLAEAATLLGLSADEIIINVQGDEPLIEPELINQLAQFLAKDQALMATIAHTIDTEDEIFNPNIVKVVLDKNNHALYFSRASIPFYRDGFIVRKEFKLPTNLTILRHIGVYGYRVNFLMNYSQLTPSPLEQVECLEQLRVLYHGYKIAVLVTDMIPHAGVDTLEDLQRIRQLKL
jgi:3-deoxy-manno-octulosonate cytidylyltransferase (CMP-KDO synthetase)